VGTPDNAAIAERLETLASLLDLAGAKHYTASARPCRPGGRATRLVQSSRPSVRRRAGRLR
jgi:hypothetical protein